MYIEIYEDVITDALQKAEFGANDSLDILRLFALFASKGKHIIVVPCLNNSTFVERLGQLMSASEISRLRSSQKKSYLLPSIKHLATVYCVVTYNSRAIGDEKAIVYNPTKMMSFEPYLEAKLITENLLDSIFLKYIAAFYARQNHMKGILFRYDSLPGGGSTTYEVVRKELIESKRFCLVIVDGDKKWPTQPYYGETAKKIMEIFCLYPSDTCQMYVMDKVMEIENLIPKRIVMQYASNKDSCDVLESDFSFFDMKYGLTVKGLFQQDVYDYWKRMPACDGFDFSSRNIAKDACPSRDEYENYIDEKGFTNIIKKGFGSDLLQITTCTPNKRGEVQFPDLENELYNIKVEDLASFQLDEWNQIGSLIFSWTCSFPERAV